MKLLNIISYLPIDVVFVAQGLPADYMYKRHKRNHFESTGSLLFFSTG